ncbi:sensor histidine kinase [Paenibacillus massiliensis]|uniref:sensor histidine kinase n=1 Tax=Paenibacillus massiliensis TaxID=225917 RepID=UPI00046F39A4|nr:sensor histidine kinase [Paenibacillus massiliensis]
MLRYIRNSKLRHQIILTSLICLIIPFGFVVYISGMFTNNLIKEQAVTNASESLKLVKLQLQNTIQGLFSIANHLEFDSSITPFLKSGNYKDTFYRGTYNVTERINSLTHDKDGVFVTVLTPDQRFYTNYLLMNQFTPLQFMEEPWFKTMDQLPAYQNKWLGIQPNYVENQQERNPQVITFVRTLRTSGTRPYAYLVVSISEKRISELFEAYKEQTILLVDDHGRILAGQEGVGETFPHLNAMNEHSAKESPVISIDGVSYLYAMEKMPYENWSIVSLIPYDDAVSKANRIYWINFLWQVGFMVLFVTILIYLLRQFTKPLVALSRVAASIEADRLSVRSGIRGENEVGMLAKSFDKMLDRVEGMVEEITTEQENKRKAELSMLQAQIHPHFLFNILNSIRMKIWLRGDRESADLLSSLSRLLRMTIQRQDRMVRLDEEISISVEYMVLMQVTLREPFHYETELAPETLDVMMPRFVLQPIIENALIHGLEKGSGTICITSEIQEDLLIVTVSDDGQGIPPDQLEELNRNLRLDTNTLSAQRQGMSGIGMNNVYHRLQLIYGKDSDMRIDSSPGEGTCVQLYIPWKGWDTYDESTAG